MSIEAMKVEGPLHVVCQCDKCKAEKQEQGEPVAWILTDKNINFLQVDSIQRLIERLKHAHHTDLCVRINGQDEWFQADWLKHMLKATPQQRTWVGLTDEEREKLMVNYDVALPDYAQAIEAKLRSKNENP